MLKNHVQKFHQPIEFLLKMENQYQIDFPEILQSTAF